jgi:hypothetical protein
MFPYGRVADCKGIPRQKEQRPYCLRKPPESPGPDATISQIAGDTKMLQQQPILASIRELTPPCPEKQIQPQVRLVLPILFTPGEYPVGPIHSSHTDRLFAPPVNKSTYCAQLEEKRRVFRQEILTIKKTDFLKKTFLDHRTVTMDPTLATVHQFLE